MFSYSNSVNPFPRLPSSFHHYSPPSFLGHDDGDIFLHHHDLLMGHLLPANPPVAETVFNMAVSNNAATMTNQDIDRLNGEYCYGPSDFLPGKIPVKKDRHSKIHTAQGPRDRRVRLSIEIARKFFDLQDMLGFDRASKTLDWLLTKAKTAIKELTQMKYSCCGGVKSPSECETVSEINEAANHPQQLVSKRKSSVTVSKEKKMKHLRKAAFHLLARESRAMARARARERTREKMCTGRLDESKKSPNTNPSILNQLRPSSRCETCRKSDSHSHFMMSFKVAAEVEEPCPHLLANPVPREDIIEESIVIERKLKPSLIFGYQQNLVTSKDISTSNDNNDNYSPNLPQNWDISSAITPSSFCAMPNMNLWTELQIHGKPWETCNNHSI